MSLLTFVVSLVIFCFIVGLTQPQQGGNDRDGDRDGGDSRNAFVLPTSSPVISRLSQVPTVSPTLPPSATCLSSPASLEWTAVDDYFVGSLDYDVATFSFMIDNILTTFRVRSHNNGIPSPTIRMKRGNRYLLTLNNNLGPESPLNPTQNNVFKDSNTTNIHTHGLHISGDGLSDNVFIAIEGGKNHTYDYRIPCDHSAGTHWYHPHHHGSTALQAGSGAAGLLFIEDDIENNSEGLPGWLRELNDNNPLDLIIQHVNLQTITSLFDEPDVDRVTSYVGANEFTLLNGEYQPTICLSAGDWRRINMLYVNIEDDIEINFVAEIPNSGTCRILSLARDGVLLHGENNETPRVVTSLVFSVASRNDIILTCDPGRYRIIDNQNNILGYISSTGIRLAINAPELEIFNPIRPSYLTSLLNEPQVNFNEYSINFGGRLVNGVAFPGNDQEPLATFTADTLQEWTINGANAHPYHQHLYHFQLTANGRGNDIRGDWLDVLHIDNIIRFKTDLYGGKMTVHCHILEHEDEGLMALMDIEGGCDYDFTSFENELPICDYNYPCLNV